MPREELDRREKQAWASDMNEQNGPEERDGALRASTKQTGKGSPTVKPILGELFPLPPLLRSMERQNILGQLREPDGGRQAAGECAGEDKVAPKGELKRH